MTSLHRLDPPAEQSIIAGYDLLAHAAGADEHGDLVVNLDVWNGSSQYTDARVPLASADARRRFSENVARHLPDLPADAVERAAVQLATQLREYLAARPARRPEEAAEPRRSMTMPAPWPAPLAEDAFYGLAGDWVRTIAPETEADPAALLVHFLACYGNVIGRGAYFAVEADRHHLNLFVAIVGRSAKARKGTAAGHARRTFARVDEGWERERVLSGLSSGEGFAYAVRDPVRRSEAVRDHGKPTGEYHEVEVDPGVDDKRLLVLENELAGALRVMAREGNNLSPQLRDAWDGRPLGTLTKHSPVRATGAHVSVVGHITREELQRHLDSTEVANGFANRFLFVCAQRAQLLPEGGQVAPAALNDLVGRLQKAIAFGRTAGELRRDPEARELWHEVYPRLSADTAGLLGVVTARAEAQAARLSCLYALLDGSATVRPEHLLAALAVWEYAEASAAHIFGDSLGDPVADTILSALRLGTPLDRTAISNLFGRHAASGCIDQALRLLVRYGLARPLPDPDTGGRPRELWGAT
jgi:hypothetical protein